MTNARLLLLPIPVLVAVETETAGISPVQMQRPMIKDSGSGTPFSTPVPGLLLLDLTPSTAYQGHAVPPLSPFLSIFSLIHPCASFHASVFHQIFLDTCGTLLYMTYNPVAPPFHSTRTTEAYVVCKDLSSSSSSSSSSFSLGEGERALRRS